MKLHLPKLLLTAVLAAVCVTSTPLFALEVTEANNTTTVTSGDWTKTYTTVHRPTNNDDFPASPVDATLIYQDDQRLGYDNVSFNAIQNCGDIVVGGGGQLYLQTWSRGKIDINNDLYLGSSSHTDAADHGALRLGTYSGTIDIRGNVTLIENTSLWQEANGHTVTIHGTTTGDYTLTAIMSNDLVFADNVDIGGLSLRESNRITFAGNNSSIDKVSGDGPLALVIADGATLEFNSGSVHLSSLNSSGTFKVNCEVTLDTVGYRAASNGYVVNEMLLLNMGNLEIGSDAIINNIAGGEFSLKDGVYGAEVDEFTGNMYHVVSGTVNVGDVATNISDAHKGYIVHSGAILDAAGTKSTKQRIELHKGSVLANSGNNVANEGGLDQEQIKELILLGDASVNTTGNLGVIGEGYAQTELDLAGHKLTKTGTGLFAVANADISAGIIDIQQGEFKLADKSNQSSALNVNDNVKVNVASGATLSLFSDRAAADKSWNFLRNATGTGIINIDMSKGSAVVIDGTTEEEATKIVFAGTINMSSDTTLALGAGHKNNDGYTHKGWALNMSQTTIALNGGGLRFCGNDTTIGTLDVNSNDTLLYHDSSDAPNQAVNANEGLVINTLNLDANLSITKKWKGWLDVKLLQGSGDLNIQTGSGDVSIKIHASADDYSGIISTTAGSVLNLGSDSTVVHTRKAINNQGTLNIGNLSVAIDELDTRFIGDDSTTGAQECSTVYTFITGNGTVNKNNGNISFTLNGTDVKGSLTADNKEFIYGPTWRYNIAANDSVQAATALQAS
ncbi:MAG: hypothetical protein IKY91_08525, partial [Akkermansia sp.]|nr:hypothetical protein [Akkermansia sp.]